MKRMDSALSHRSNCSVAITGIGVVSAYGTDVSSYYAGLLAEKPVIKLVELPLENRTGRAWWSTVRGFDALDWMDAKIADGTDVVAHWAIAAAHQAVEQSGLSLDPLRTAVVQGTSMCGVQSVMWAQYLLDTSGPSAFPRKTIMKALTNMGAAQIAMRYKLHGPSLTVTTACASTLDAIGTAALLIATGRADTAIVGGTEAGHSLDSGGARGSFVPAMAYAPLAFGMQSDEADLARACMPFDVDRSGIATSEGSAALVLERGDLAAARKAEILGYVAGYGSIADAYHPSAPEPSGEWEALAMTQALEDSGLAADRIDCLYAHATGTPIGDMPEILAINRVHGRRQHPLPVTSIKGHFGHAAAASGGMSLIAGLMNMSEGRFINTANTKNPDPAARFAVCLGSPQTLDIRAFQVNAFGFGGQNASLVVTRLPPREN